MSNVGKSLLLSILAFSPALASAADRCDCDRILEVAKAIPESEYQSVASVQRKAESLLDLSDDRLYDKVMSSSKRSGNGKIDYTDGDLKIKGGGSGESSKTAETNRIRILLKEVIRNESNAFASRSKTKYQGNEHILKAIEAWVRCVEGNQKSTTEKSLAPKVVSHDENYKTFALEIEGNPRPDQINPFRVTETISFGSVTSEVDLVGEEFRHCLRLMVKKASDEIGMFQVVLSGFDSVTFDLPAKPPAADHLRAFQNRSLEFLSRNEHLLVASISDPNGIHLRWKEHSSPHVYEYVAEFRSAKDGSLLLSKNIRATNTYWFFPKKEYPQLDGEMKVRLLIKFFKDPSKGKGRENRTSGHYVKSPVTAILPKQP